MRILERDQHTCQIQGPGCTHIATHVDHIIQLAHGGPAHDDRNLRATCRTCNVRRGRKRTDWQGRSSTIFYYAPTPGSETDTHTLTAAAQRYNPPHDLIISTTLLAAALAPHNPALARPAARYLWHTLTAQIQRGNTGPSASIAIIHTPHTNIAVRAHRTHHINPDGSYL